VALKSIHALRQCEHGCELLYSTARKWFSG
jgi:hypothetical protein